LAELFEEMKADSEAASLQVTNTEGEPKVDAPAFADVVYDTIHKSAHANGRLRMCEVCGWCQHIQHLRVSKPPSVGEDDQLLRHGNKIQLVATPGLYPEMTGLCVKIVDDKRPPVVLPSDPA
jgi:hypothetical protein